MGHLFIHAACPLSFLSTHQLSTYLMKLNWIVCFLIGIGLTGCFQNDPIPKLTDLQERFHGKYKAISSISSEALDVNLDGKVSTDMLQEIPELTKPYQNYLELRIYGPSAHSVLASFLFTQWWPEQYIWLNNEEWKWQPIAYDPKLIVNYAMQGATRTFSFSPGLDKLLIDPADADNSLRWKRPEAVTVVGEHTIQVVNKKTVYTRSGSKEIVITTIYERFTTVT